MRVLIKCGGGGYDWTFTIRLTRRVGREVQNNNVPSVAGWSIFGFCCCFDPRPGCKFSPLPSASLYPGRQYYTGNW